MSKELNIIPIDQWFSGVDRPLIISGPCSAESEEQVLATAHEIKKTGRVDVFRAGIWKPRTRPGNFEGVGKEGLKWLQKVKKETGLPVAVEVATPEHIAECLAHDIDILWIGARTTSNPFSIQALADALKGIDIPVLVKNPINPDIELWIGALERFNKAGIKKLAAIHRGFFPFEKTFLRNIPKWEVPIELKRRYPNLPIICDPSHITGDSKYLESITQKALDLSVDGIMIESHINPKTALSDADQQITPTELNSLLKSLTFRADSSDDVDFTNKLEQYREEIDSIDTQLVELLAKRMDVVENIGSYKQKKNVTIFQLCRWERIIKTRKELAEKLGLSGDFIVKLLQLVHKESILRQEGIMKKNSQK